jgi:hypothetical protein
MLPRILAYAVIFVMLVLAYWFMIRPLLKARPAFAEFYAVEQSMWAAFWLKLDSIKTKLLAVLLIIASGLIETHDFLMPMATGMDFTAITSKVPPAVWPFVTMGQAALFYWLRKITAAAQDKKLVAVEAGVITAKEAITGSNPVADAEVRGMPQPTATTTAEKE